MDRVRASISAMLTEIEQAHKALGIPCEAEERNEALAVLTQIERAVLAKGLDGDRKWSPKQATG